MQSFSTTHNLQLALRKRYVWKLRTSSTKRFAWLQECHGLYSKSNSQYGEQDARSQEARSSWDPSSDSKSYGKLAATSWITEFLEYLFLQSSSRIQHVRIGKFENHQHKESFLQDLSQTQKVNKFSKESKDLLADMNNTEIFEHCENSSKQQCPECNTDWEIGIIYCSCGRNVKSSQRPTELEQNNYDVTSIPGYVIKKNRSRGAKHGPSERHRMYYQAKPMLKKGTPEKARKPPNNTFTMVRQRNVQEFVVADRVERKKIMLYDKIALEKHIYVATRAESIQNSKHWILTLNAEGPQQPLNQRPDFVQAKRECNRLHDEHLART